ncbi:alpha/beta hydrolase family protein [Pararhodobacter sp.]|uniref:alpha/beta hydrolase family protein n=1 Tax=Pararhodobacter sp. TaxID=2127056 RepID=UPI002FE3C983
MFRYFPTNYVWDLSINLSIEMGGRLGEIEAMCAPLKEAALTPEDGGTLAFRKVWSEGAHNLIDLAQEDLARGRSLSASNKLMRAANYLITAERLQAHGSEGRMALYRKHLATFYQALGLGGTGAYRVSIPYAGKHLSGIFLPAEGVTGPQPVLVQVNGFDSTKEMRVMAQLPGMLAKRGIASLVLDQPGTGEALRLQGLTARHDSEHWATPVYEWLAARPDVDEKRIGMEGVSLGGYYAPRAVAFEPRFACGVSWGANHDWRDVQKRRLEREGNLPVPHYWAHACWVFGAKDTEDFMQKAEHMHLDGVLDRIRVPYLVTHGKHDSQIPLKWAHRTYEQLVNSPRRELVIFDERTGGVQHSSVDNSGPALDCISDFVAECLGGRIA